MAIWAPEVLAEHHQFAAEGDLFGEFIHCQVEAHARRESIHSREAQRDGLKPVAAHFLKQVTFEPHLESA